MNWSQIVTVLLITSSAIAADDTLVRRGLDEISSAEQQASYLMQSPISPADKERVRYIQQRLISSANILQNALNSPNYPPYPPPPNPNSEIELYNSDRCSSDLIGRVSSYTNCEAAFSGEKAAWGIKINGECMDISDMPAVKACDLFKGAGNSNSVKIYHSDRCQGDLLAIVNYSTNCQSLVGLPQAWGIESRGQCTDISDMSPETACERFKQ